MALLRDAGFTDIRGIDFSEDAVKRSRVKGFTVDLMDAKDIRYPDRCFGLYFSEGLWEHFPDPEPYIAEACRVAGEWVFVIQPDHHTVCGYLLHLGWVLLGGGGIKEYSFPIGYYVEALRRHGFTLVARDSTALREQALLLFRRTEA